MFTPTDFDPSINFFVRSIGGDVPVAFLDDLVKDQILAFQRPEHKPQHHALAFPYDEGDCVCRIEV